MLLAAAACCCLLLLLLAAVACCDLLACCLLLLFAACCLLLVATVLWSEHSGYIVGKPTCERLAALEESAGPAQTGGWMLWGVYSNALLFFPARSDEVFSNRTRQRCIENVVAASVRPENIYSVDLENQVTPSLVNHKGVPPVENGDPPDGASKSPFFFFLSLRPRPRQADHR